MDSQPAFANLYIFLSIDRKHSMPIAEHRKKGLTFLIFNFVVCQTFYLNPSLAGTMNFYHGTLLSVIYSTDYVIIGAEGAATRYQERTSADETCKIVKLNGDTIFAMYGLSAQDHHFDPRAVAREAFIAGVPLRHVANIWGSTLASRHHEAFIQYGKENYKNMEIIMINALFARSSDPLSLINAQVIHDKSRPVAENFGHRISDMPYSQQGRPWVLGTGANEALEFFANQSDRAKDARKDVNQKIELEHLTGADAEAIMMKHSTEFAIKWANNSAIGGSASVIIAERGKPVRWAYQSDACRQMNKDN